MQTGTLYFIGGGIMASAMIQGYEALTDRLHIVVCDPSEDARTRHETLGRRTLSSIDEIQGADAVVLGFKPQHFPDASAGLNAALSDNALVVSMMVGVSCATLEGALPGARVVRVMPNTPMAVGMGMTAVAGGRGATQSDIQLATDLCGASGEVLEVEESQIDAVAAVSGSGPAYFFRFCEALLEAATDTCGFSEEQARLLVSQTAVGAIAYLASQENFPAARLREEVTSRGGTTEAALRVMNEGNLTPLVAAALKAALTRAEELNADVDPGE